MTLTEKEKEILRDRDREYFDQDEMYKDHLENSLLLGLIKGDYE